MVKKDVVKTDKASTIRVSQSTKQLLGSLSEGKESYDELLTRLAKTVKNLSAEGPETIQKGNVIQTEYKRRRHTFAVDTADGMLSVTCAFNDLRGVNVRHKKMLYTTISHPDEEQLTWQIDLEILNIAGITESPKHRVTSSHEKPNVPSELIYFVVLKKVIEETFLISLYGFVTEYDYFSWDKWRDIYTHHNLSEESFHNDVEKKLRDSEFKNPYKYKTQ